MLEADEFNGRINLLWVEIDQLFPFCLASREHRSPVVWCLRLYLLSRLALIVVIVVFMIDSDWCYLLRTVRFEFLVRWVWYGNSRIDLRYRVIHLFGRLRHLIRLQFTSSSLCVCIFKSWFVQTYISTYICCSVGWQRFGFWFWQPAPEFLWKRMFSFAISRNDCVVLFLIHFNVTKFEQ